MKLFYLYIWREDLQKYLPATAEADRLVDGECLRVPIRATLRAFRSFQHLLEVPSFTLPAY